jgi:hypothetical protein
MDMPLSNAPEGGFIGIGSVSEDFTLSEFLFRKGRIVPIRLKVRPCLRRSGYAQAGRSLSEGHPHVRLIKILCNIRVYPPTQKTTDFTLGRMHEEQSIDIVGGF